MTANSDTSGPSRYSSMTTRPQAAACASGLVAVVGDHDPLAGGEPVVLDHVRRPELVERRGGLLRGACRPGRQRRGHAGGGHDVLGERLGALEAGRPRPTGRSRRCLRRARRRRPRPPAAPRARRRPGRRRARSASAATAAPSSRVDGVQLGHRGDAGVARRGVQLADPRVAGQRQGQGVLAAAAADDQDLHSSGRPSGAGTAQIRSCTDDGLVASGADADGGDRARRTSPRRVRRRPGRSWAGPRQRARAG